MIKMETNFGMTSIEMNGSPLTIMADTVIALTAIYRGVPEDAREFFRKEVQKATAEDGQCWMTDEQKHEKVTAMLRDLLEKMGRKEAGSGESHS